MPIRDIFKVNRKTFFNPRGWIDADALAQQNRTIVAVLKSMFTTPRPEREETFAQAMKRLDMSEQDVEFGATNYRIYALIFLLIGFLFFFYAFFLLFRYASFFSWLLGLGVAALFFAQAFKYDFWSLQMRRRKLGLKFGDWQNSILGVKEEHK